MDQPLRTASQLAVPMDYDAVYCACSSQVSRCVQCLERVAACALLHFSKNSSVIDLSSRSSPASSSLLHPQPVTAVVTSLFTGSGTEKSMENPASHWTEDRSSSALTPPPSDVDSGVMSPPSSFASSFTTDDSGESEDDDIPPVTKRSRLFELLTSDEPIQLHSQSVTSQFYPLDLSCHGNVIKDHSMSPTTSIPATVTRHRSQQIVPQNSNPRTSMSHVRAEVVSTASKHKQVQPSAGPPVPTVAGEVHLTSASQQPQQGLTSCIPTIRDNVSKQPAAPSFANSANILVNSNVVPATAPSCLAIEPDSQFAQERLASIATDYINGNGTCTVSTQFTTLPIICTSVGGLLMPLSSTPATIIVVNCPPANKVTTTTTTSKSTSGSGHVSSASSSSSSSSSRLCPIAPAPPSSMPLTIGSFVNDAATKDAVGGARRLLSVNSDLQRKTFSCDEPGCGKTYFKNSHLKVHKRVHTGEKPFVCEYPECSKKFARSDELSRHRRTHTGEKRYACTVCEQHFVRSDHLSKHLHRHVLCRTSSSSLTSSATN